MRFAVVVFAMSAGAGSAAAQPVAPAGGGGSPMGFAPYLNLLRGGNPAANYFGIVRPEQQAQQQFGQIQQQIGRTNQKLQGISDSLAPAGDQPQRATGHAAGFDNTLGYFNRLPAGGGGGRPGGGLGRPALPQLPAPPRPAARPR